MKHRAATPAAWLGMVVLLTGCHHASKVTQAAPAAPPEIGPVMVSVPPPTHHDRPEIVVSTPPVSIPPPEPTRRPARPARRSSGAPASSSTSQASNASPVPPASSTLPIPLGELSAGGEVSSGLRQQTAELLKSQQQRIDRMSRTALSAHSTEVAQAKTFLERANTSWNATDYEGAHTLVIKAKVLLDDMKL